MVNIMTYIEGAFLEIAGIKERNAERFLWITEDLVSKTKILKFTAAIFVARRG